MSPTARQPRPRRLELWRLKSWGVELWRGKHRSRTRVMLLLAALTALAPLCVSPYPEAELQPKADLWLTDAFGARLQRLPTDPQSPTREAWVPLSQVPPTLVALLVAAEDQRFYEHPGVDLVGLVRAGWLNLKRGRRAFGGSTLTMQLAKLLKHQGQPRTWRRKGVEVLDALRLEKALSKSAILEQYINRAYYGNGAYGIDAGAKRYFDKPAAALSEAEATLLIAIPRAPSRYDPLRHLERLKQRRDTLLTRLAEQGGLSPAELQLIQTEPLALRAPHRHAVAPHFVAWVTEQLSEKQRRAGGTLRTSLDLNLQELLEHRLTQHQAALESLNLQQAGLVVLDATTSRVLAMIGSTGQGTGHHINITTRRRHPGSALKPFVYAAAIEAGDSPASLALDIEAIPSAYHNPHLSQPEHGAVRYREALAGSFNLAAVHTLERIGTERVMDALRAAGVGRLEGTPQDYGPRLALGSAKVRLLDLAAGYGFLVRGGKVRPATPWMDEPLPAERQVFTPATSWMVMDMLADNNARRQAFGDELPLDLPYRVAAKTGTSRGFADTVAVAATSEYIVAAWAGNFDGSPSQGLIAMESAAPLVRAALIALSSEHPLTLPEPPHTLSAHRRCALSGMAAGPHCPHHVVEHQRVEAPSPSRCIWHALGSDGQRAVHLPPEVQAWRDAARQRVGLPLGE